MPLQYPSQNKIKILPEDVAIRIAAGEVIERPFSIVRELIDNAIDSGATDIEIEVTAGGLETIIISDNGKGISSDQFNLLGLRHATSKIRSDKDLESIVTLGFRGEALASISACSEVEIVSRPEGQRTATRLFWLNGKRNISICAGSKGTRVSVSNLFSQIPARRKHLRRVSSELVMCRRVFLEKAIAHPAISFRFTADGIIRLSLLVTSLIERVSLILGKGFDLENLKEEKRNFDGFSVTVVGSRPELARRDKSKIMVFVNKRRIFEYGLIQAIEYGYGAFIPGGKYPVACAFINVSDGMVDFNVHPTKKEVRFRFVSPIHQGMVQVTEQVANSFGLLSPVNENKSGNVSNSLPFSFERTDNILESVGSNTFSEIRGINSGEKYTNDQKSNLEFKTDYGYSKSSRKLKSGILNPGITANNVRYLGQVLGLFFIAEIGDSVYFVDQHAAHERVIFEDLKNRDYPVQQLLVPIHLDLESNLRRMIGKFSKLINKIGITIKVDVAGKATEIIALSSPLHKVSEEWLINQLTLFNGSGSNIERTVLGNIACKLAIKEGEAIDKDAAELILKQSFKIDFQHCPHGRPLWHAVSRRQLIDAVGR